MKGLNQLADLTKENLEILVDKTYTAGNVQMAYSEISATGVIGKEVITVSAIG